MSESKYICTHCMHKQDTTDLGQCEECGYENLVMTNEFVDYQIQQLEQRVNLLEQKSRAIKSLSLVNKMEVIRSLFESTKTITFPFKFNPEDHYDK